ncbi:hypothetical protein B0H17DRAFT_1151548 [Mycena rosella]|uniref:Uncharacterized protein n=1 Tax=Mycena rosella TaxID=1033263 RepID=A0AAD7BJA3_MYCRO|nr:hypothetical protein B0H17DRAFT_1151548 [Mycena rosella]
MDRPSAAEHVRNCMRNPCLGSAADDSIRAGQRIARLGLLYAAGEDPGPQELLEFRGAALPICSFAPAERKGGGMNTVGAHQGEGSPQKSCFSKNRSFAFQVRAQWWASSGVYSASIGTQQLRLQAVAASNLPDVRATTAGGKERVVISREEGLKEDASWDLSSSMWATFFMQKSAFSRRQALAKRQLTCRVVLLAPFSSHGVVVSYAGTASTDSSVASRDGRDGPSGSMSMSGGSSKRAGRATVCLQESCLQGSALLIWEQGNLSGKNALCSATGVEQKALALIDVGHPVHPQNTIRTRSRRLGPFDYEKRPWGMRNARGEVQKYRQIGQHEIWPGRHEVEPKCGRSSGIEVRLWVEPAKVAESFEEGKVVADGG